MVDESKTVDLTALLSKIDELTSKIEIQESKAQAREVELKKEFEIQANKIHSSYAKKMKKAGIEVDDTESDGESRKPSKRELELQESVEKLVKRSEEAERKARLASLRNDVSERLVKNGINPDAVDTIFTVLNAKNAFQDDGDEGGFKMKVEVDGAPVALPIETAIKHYVKSPDARFYKAPIGASGSGSTTPTPTKATDGKPKPVVEVDWSAIGREMIHGSRG